MRDFSKETIWLEEEKKIVRILQKADGQQLTYSRLLCKSLLTAREFRGCIESLIERQAIIAHEIDSGYKNRVSLVYTLNPALNHLDIN